MKHIEKVGKIVAIIGVVFSILWGIFIYIFPSSSDKISNPDLHGIWLSKYSYPMPTGTAEVRGTTEYFKNGSYNFVGQLGFSAIVENKPIQGLYNLDGSGEWIADSNNITTKLLDMKSHLVSLTYNAESIDKKKLAMVTGIALPVMEDSIPKGLSEQFKIITIKKDHIVLEVDDPQGQLFQFTMTKQDKRFQK